MKCQIPEISWHNRDPVLSVDIQPRSSASPAAPFLRLASAGTDSHVLIWYMTPADNGLLTLDCVADLARHQRAVNVVRWSPSGEFLASGDDESVIFIWKQKGETEVLNICDAAADGSTGETTADKEIWITLRILRGHMEDVYDLCWSPDSAQLISASVDNSAIIWDVHKGKSAALLQEAKGFVQGCAWDPRGRYVATLSSDRCLRVYDAASRKVVAKNNKCQLPVSKGHPAAGQVLRLYHDDTLQTFFRRLCFSPDGALLVAPTGVVDLGNDSGKPLHTSYVYTRNSWKQPAIVLPSPDQYTVAARFCPVLFELHGQAPPVIPLPYRMIFAIATRSSVYLYDTQQKAPFALISNIHYTRLTDLAWSADGSVLVVSSTDGFCSIITFAEGELGKVYRPDTPSEGSPDPIIAPNVIDDRGDTKIEIPCDKILSVDEKFTSPEKKDKPATPIPVKRRPLDEESTTPKNKTPTRIAIRRAPRSEVAPKATTTATTPALPDEAVDAWPIDEPAPAHIADLTGVETDRTQDIRLMVYSSDEEAAMEAEKQNSPPKTPRRVEFRTISTPKSKKKLL